MTPEEWAEYLDNNGASYNLVDTAMALIGDEDDLASKAQPVMILHAQHLETNQHITFTFFVPKEQVSVMGDTFTQMSLDIMEDKNLNQIRNPESDL